MNLMPDPGQPNEQELLHLARTGDRTAYGRLVARYQTTVASIAYAICGDFSQSEDVAQEAFVAAWRGLGTLEDDTRFKAWLCGITRNLAQNLVRRQARHAGLDSSYLPEMAEPADETPIPSEVTARRDQSALIWRTLGLLPEAYREPLILFYREQQSVERVAAALDLSEEVVRQRLARGRLLLRGQLEKVIAHELGATTPGAMFTAAVLGGLTAAAPPLVGASGASAATKGAALVKSGGSFLPALPILTHLVMWRDNLRFARAPEDRRFFNRLWTGLTVICVLAMAGSFGMIWALRSGYGEARIFRLLSQVWPLVILLALAGLAGWAWRPFVAWGRRINPPANMSPLRRRFWFGPDRARIWRSRITFLGLPLLDIRFGRTAEEPLVRGTARGWIAFGDVAHGVVLGAGGFATGTIALGVVSVGFLSTGAATVGLAAFGGLAVGGLADGIVAVGYLASGIAAAGYEAAKGTVAVARHLAWGSLWSAADQTSLKSWPPDHLLLLLGKTQWVSFVSVFIIPFVGSVGTNWLVRSPALPSATKRFED